MEKKCIGVDIAKKDFKAAIRDKKGEIKKNEFKNNEKGFKKFIAWVKKHPSEQYHFCMEATGKYGDKLALFLHEAGHIVSMVNPAKIKFYMKSRLARNKTDFVDAGYILQFCEGETPDIWRPDPLEIQVLQELVKRVEALTVMATQEQNRLENVSDVVKNSITDLIKHLNKEIKKIMAQIKDHINKHPELKKNSELLESIIGIGEKTSAKFLAYIVDINNFSNAKKVTAFIGLNPQQSQSGTSLNNSRLSKTGDSEFRKILYMPALVAIKLNPVLKKFYEKLTAKGKPKMVAICAVMRKLVHIIYGVLKSKKPFDPAFGNS